MRFPRACVFLLVAVGHTGCTKREAAPVAPQKAAVEEPRPSPPKPITATTATSPETKPEPRVATAGAEGAEDKPATGERGETGAEGGKAGKTEADRDESKTLEKKVGREDQQQAVAPRRIDSKPKTGNRERAPKLELPKPNPAPPRKPLGSTKLEHRDGRGGSGPTYRAGALRLGGSAKSFYILRYTPASGLRLPKLARKLKGQTPEAEVAPFRQLERALSAEVQPVDRGGEIVAIALALQLEKLGWRVNVAGKELLAAGLPIPGSPIATNGYRIDGAVRFETGSEGARLGGKVRFLRKGAVLATISAEASGSAPATLSAFERRRQAAEQALSKFVATVLGDRLDSALAATAP